MSEILKMQTLFEAIHEFLLDLGFSNEEKFYKKTFKVPVGQMIIVNGVRQPQQLIPMTLVIEHYGNGNIDEEVDFEVYEFSTEVQKRSFYHFCHCFQELDEFKQILMTIC